MERFFQTVLTKESFDSEIANFLCLDKNVIIYHMSSASPVLLTSFLRKFFRSVKRVH